MAKVRIYTIGHSNLAFSQFVAILQKNGIELVIDVRSEPYSRYSPHFNREELKRNLKNNDISYDYQGHILGGRPNSGALYIDGRVSYDKLSEESQFIRAVGQIISIGANKRLAIMCSERDPINCHRALLIGKILKQEGADVLHIIDGEKSESQEDLEIRLLSSDANQGLLFSEEAILNEAYKHQSEKIAHKKEDKTGKKQEEKTIILFTIGFAKKSAREFFEILKKANVQKVIDIRLNNKSQLAGFTKRDDLEYFLAAINGISYQHVPGLAPEKELLDAYRNKKISWQEYESRFYKLIRERNISELFKPEDLHMSCLLCTENNPQRCHRRLVAERFASIYPDITIKHL